MPSDNVSHLLIRTPPADNVAIAVHPLGIGEGFSFGEQELTLVEPVGAGHKIATRRIGVGEEVIRYGYPIGVATRPIEPGWWVHHHNLHTSLDGTPTYRYEPSPPPPSLPLPVDTFEGYVRSDGSVGIRNEIWVIPTVGCVNTLVSSIARSLEKEAVAAGLDGIFAFPHPFGCSQLGDDHEDTRRILAGLIRHPNAGGVLVVGLGCENNQIREQMHAASGCDEGRVRYFNAQEVADEHEAGVRAARELIDRAAADRRTPVPINRLVVGVKCGGSDGFSGITANPLVGRVADRLCASGGVVLMTEAPEMFGAEQILMHRARSRPVFESVVQLIEGFKSYYRTHGRPVYENPSPGNREGGLTTLEEKSLGAIQKGGRSAVTGVLAYAERARLESGVGLVAAPGNDAVSGTALVAAGAQLILFTSGRGNPLGFPAPVIKIASNSDVFSRKPHWFDYDAGRLLAEEDAWVLRTDELASLLLEVASGTRRTQSERNGYREIAIWKRGVTL